MTPHERALWWAQIRALEDLANVFPWRRASFYARADYIETKLRRGERP